jgi:hypothetical protein
MLLRRNDESCAFPNIKRGPVALEAPGCTELLLMWTSRFVRPIRVPPISLSK